jgi:Fe-S cluster assembly protein SufD
VQHFTSDVARALGGPDWLVERRLTGLEQAAADELPSTSEEVWRYSLVDELDLDEWRPAGGVAAGEAPPGPMVVAGSLGEAAAVVVVRNGAVVWCELAEEARTAGVTAGPLTDLGDAVARPLLEGTDLESPDLFDRLHQAFTIDPVVVRVPRGVALSRPIVVVDWIDEPGVAVFGHLIVELGEDAEARVVEWQGSDDLDALAVHRTDLVVAASARLHHDLVQDRALRVWQFARQGSRVGQAATLSSTAAGLGGEYARLRSDCRLAGRGATGNLHAAYLGELAQTLDYRTFQEHEAPDTTSELLYLGALGGTSRSIYTGTIHVHKDARGTNAFQTNRNVKLSEGAWAESVPNLEIENNDVHCSHASTVGPIDADQRFYLESRGVRPEVAERLIVGGFFDEVLDRFGSPAVAALVAEALRVRLARLEITTDAAPAVAAEGGTR